MIGCYCRVSTPDQALERQLEATSDYAQKHLDADPADIDVYRDKSTGTDTERTGYKELMADVEAGEVDVVVVKSVSRVSRSIRDLDRTVERIREGDAAVHFVDESLTLDAERDDPMQRAMFRLMGVFAELEADMIQQRTWEGITARQNADEEYHHGRPPLGFEKEDGQLIGGDNNHQVAAVLEQVQKEELSKR